MVTSAEDSETSRPSTGSGTSPFTPRPVRYRALPLRARPREAYEALTPDDLRSLIHISTARMACFSFDSPLPVGASPEELAELIYTTPSHCLEASLSFALASDRATVDDVIGLPLGDLLPRTLGYDALFERWQEYELIGQCFEVELLDSDASSIVMQAVMYARIENETFSRLWVILRDVTVHARAVQALARNELHYRSLVERPGLVLARIRHDGTCDYVSPTIGDMFGLTSREVTTTPSLFASRIHPDDVQRYEVVLAARRNKITEPVETECRIRLANGKYHWFFIRQFPKLMPNMEPEYFDVIAIDIQRHRSLEEEVLQVSATNAAAERASGVAHDLNNHLTALIGQIDSALSSTGDEGSVRDSLQLARQAALACTQMTKQLGGRGRNAPSNEHEVSVGSLLTQATSLARPLMPAKIELIVADIDPTLTVYVDSVQLQQVFLNLLLNARDGMPEGGELRVGAEVLASEGAWGTRKDVKIHVSDTGVGIPAELQERIFDHRFTTKPEGSGTGLGLAMVKSIVELHGGSIELLSTEGRGSTFSVVLPLYSGTHVAVAPVKADVSAPAPTLLESRGSIVIADDDVMVRGMLLSALSRLGFDAVAVADGDSLSKLADSQSFPHSVVLLDDSMPGTRGLDLILELEKRWPDAFIVLTSGDSTVRNQIGSNLPNTAFLEKPFTIDELSALLCERRNRID